MKDSVGLLPFKRGNVKEIEEAKRILARYIAEGKITTSNIGVSKRHEDQATTTEEDQEKLVPEEGAETCSPESYVFVRGSETGGGESDTAEEAQSYLDNTSLTQ